MKNDDMSDDEFDAFLNGKDDLSRRLQALPQPASSAQLDAAIFQRIELALAQEQRPQAANDAGDDMDKAAPAPRLRPGSGMRWRVPAGIAAALLAGAFAHQVFDASGDARPSAVVSTEADVGMPAPAPAPAPAPPTHDTPSPPPPPAPAAAAQVESAKMAPPKPAQAEPRVKKPSAAQQAVAKPQVVQEASVASGAAAPMPAPAPAPPPAAAMAPPAAPAPVASTTAYATNVRPRELAGAAQDGSANVLGRLSKSTEERSEALTVTGSRSKADAVVAPAEEWLRVIDSLLKAQLKNDAKAEWLRFRKAYPDYPVSEELKARIEALP